jgi:hypothetical protein
MAAKKGLPLLLPVLGLVSAQSSHLPNYNQYTNLFLGSTGGGNRFSGVAAVPFAMVKLRPDVRSGTQDAYSGYPSSSARLGSRDWSSV